jgi:hypothetical protein
MPIHRLYLDFFEFLDAAKTQDPWIAYQAHYLDKHRIFLESYWRNFPRMDETVLRDRVHRVRPEDYAPLIEFGRGDGFDRVEEDLDRCKALIPPPSDPDIYLYVGFFSTEGAVVDVSGVPVITIGLERFRSFEVLPIVLAHEYAHWIGRVHGTEHRSQRDRMISEGVSVLFSMEAFPGFEEHHYFLIPHKRKLAEVKETPVRPFETSEMLELSPLTWRYWGYVEVRKRMEQGVSLTDLLVRKD